MIKAYLVLGGGMFPIQVRKRTLKYLYGAMYNEFRWKTRFQRWWKRVTNRKPKQAKPTMVPAKKQQSEGVKT